MHFTTLYLPAIRKESDEDLFLIKIILTLAKRGGLNWIDDFLILAGEHWITSPMRKRSHNICSVLPIYISLTDMPVFLHELAHSILQKFDYLLLELDSMVTEYFSQKELSWNPLKPSDKQIRQELLIHSKDYWSFEKLTEIFCDVYATYVCGPAYYFFNVDKAIRVWTRTESG